MKKSNFLALCCLFMLVSFRTDKNLLIGAPTTIEQGQSVNMCQLTNDTWQAGEELTYKIYYNWNFVWLSAGEVTLKVKEGENNQYHLSAVGRTYDSYEWFFEVNDNYEAWVDKNTLLPNYSERSVHEGGYKIFEKVSYNQNSQNTQVWRAKQRGDKETKTDHPVKHCVHDVLSIMYSLRNVDFYRQGYGAKVPFQVFMDQEEFELSFKYTGQFKNKKIHNLGRYDVMEFQPTLIKGTVFAEDSKMKVYVADDRNRIPVLIESPVSVGSVKVVLKSYKGLSFPMTAKK
jgi:Protein of unknown function (DUF3108)